jgi:hypothetical protein
VSALIALEFPRELDVKRWMPASISFLNVPHIADEPIAITTSL